MLGAQFVTEILIAAGSLIFIVPGVIIAIMFLLVMPVIVVEQIGVFESLGRSRRFVHQRWGNIFILILILGLIIGIKMGVFSVATTFLGDVNPITILLAEIQ